MNYYVFRINYEEDYKKLRNEIKCGRLRQGWGSTGMDITKNFEEYAEAWNVAYGSVDDNSKLKNRYNCIKIMENIQKGDIIIVPKLTLDDNKDWWNNFTILECAEGYSFDPINNVSGDKDFGHIIGVNIICSCNYEYNDSSRTVSGKFKAYQRCVNNAYDVNFKNAVISLINEYRGNDNKFLDTNMTALGALNNPNGESSELKVKYLESVVETINNWMPNQLEKVITQLFEQNGYVKTANNRYDKKGGDIDIVFDAFIPGTFISDVCGIDGDKCKMEIRVQAKNKKGKDINDQEGVSQLLIMEGNERAVNILINTTTEFTEDAKALADKNVILINGKQFAALLVKYGLDVLDGLKN